MPSKSVYWENPEKYRAQSRAYEKANKEKRNAAKRVLYLKQRQSAIEHYGGKCVCCDEDTYEFLALDHINGGGIKARGSDRRKFYRSFEKYGYPDDIQLLCHNCNLAKGFYGRCPHD